MKVDSEKPVKQMADIQHLIQDASRIQREIRPLVGEARERKQREWQEISDTLNTKMSAAKYFNLNDHLFMKYFSVQVIEYVDTVLNQVGFVTFNAYWLDMLYLAEITTAVAYGLAVDAVLQKGGQAS